MASDKGLQNMSQKLLDACVEISMPHRKPPVQQGSRRRRASFSEFERIKAIPSPSCKLHLGLLSKSALLTSLSEQICHHVNVSSDCGCGSWTVVCCCAGTESE